MACRVANGEIIFTRRSTPFKLATVARAQTEGYVPNDDQAQNCPYLVPVTRPNRMSKARGYPMERVTRGHHYQLRATHQPLGQVIREGQLHKLSDRPGLDHMPDRDKRRS